MPDMIINASPTKDFFISMLIKDIDLVRSVVDLVDNSIDGAKRLRPDGNYNGLTVNVEVNPEYFKISDNCGGIPVEIARNYAFRFGRPGNAPLTSHSIGLFGVGMKRAIFKLGKYFQIESTTETEYFIIEEDIEIWKNIEEWEFDFEVLHEELEPKEVGLQGTIIKITNLHESVSEDFKLENYRIRIANEIKDAHLENIEKGISIAVNGQPLIAEPILLLHSEDLKPGYYETVLEYNKPQPVTVKMYAGVYEPDPSEAGWYMLCNGRLILSADRSFLTGWGSTGIPNYHNDYARFRGYIFFESDDPSLLPWNTTKTGIDTDSPRFRAVRDDMRNLMKPVIKFLRDLRKEKSTEEDSNGLVLQTAIDEATASKLTEVSTNTTFVSPQTVPKPRSKAKTGTIQYSRPIEKIKQVQRTLDVSSYKEVGEKTFDYFWTRECDE